MPTPEHDAQTPHSSLSAVPGVSMKDLLASCAAATAVSTPPSDRPGAEDRADDVTVADIRPPAGRAAA
ncbi:hypothetical protein [uncultured Streptomyces sp.]|uniref:hypothetical protein n=1 Tax=uncultured Streptomyces sp. TaxID=174707 RepID=UPI0026278225|nr:hypothetical protein [uncultured Streptomyces sp.]